MNKIDIAKLEIRAYLNKKGNMRYSLSFPGSYSSPKMKGFKTSKEAIKAGHLYFKNHLEISKYNSYEHFVHDPDHIDL